MHDKRAFNIVDYYFNVEMQLRNTLPALLFVVLSMLKCTSTIVCKLSCFTCSMLKYESAIVCKLSCLSAGAPRHALVADADVVEVKGPFCTP